MNPEDEKSSAGGDAGDENPLSTSPAPAPPKPPDVELIVDGFGFMPKDSEGLQSHLSNILGKSTKKIDEMLEPEQKQSPCGSSMNIDVVRRYTWKTKNRMTVQIISYGATITSIYAPDRKGVPDDVLAGFDCLEEYFDPRNPYIGATLGRFANMVVDGTMVVRPSGRVYMLTTNMGPHHYNGGLTGFDKVNWRSYVSGNKVIMSHVSERFSEGYPGTVMAQICFEVTCDNTVKIEMKCTTSEPTIINMSNSPYFNLAGHHAGLDCMMEHVFTINADKYTQIDENGIVTGEKKVVGGTPYDFRVPRILRTMIPKIPRGGYNINYCITQGTEQDLTFQARALHPGTGRVLEVYSNQPGMQFYTGNDLPDPNKIIEMPQGEEEEEEPPKKNVKGPGETGAAGEAGEDGEDDESMSSARGAEEEASEGKVSFGFVPLIGKGGAFYNKHSLFCLMPQNYPDAINHRNFPSPILNPGEVYVHRIQYKFGILLGKYV